MNQDEVRFVDLGRLPKGDSALMVFTSQSPQKMLGRGVSAAWKLDGARARQCRYLVCTWNSGGEWAQPDTGLSHGEGFLVALISAIEPAPLSEGPGRWNIRFREFARISRPELWNRNRNPVAYTSLHELGINPNDLRFEALPEIPTEAAPAAAASPAALTIVQAKEALAATYGVLPQSVEITIRG